MEVASTVGHATHCLIPIHLGAPPPLTALRKAAVNQVKWSTCTVHPHLSTACVQYILKLFLKTNICENCPPVVVTWLTVFSPFRAEMSRKETAAKSSTRLWTSTLGTIMLAGSSAFQSIRPGISLKSVGRSSSSVLPSSSSPSSFIGP